MNTLEDEEGPQFAMFAFVRLVDQFKAALGEQRL